VSGPTSAATTSGPRAGGVSTLGRILGGSERPWDPANRLGLLVLCAVLIVALSLAYPRFPTSSNAFTILLNITAIGIAAFGSALLLIGGNVDLSIGGIFAIVSVTTAMVVRETQEPMLGLVLAIVMGGAVGYLNGRLVRALKINPLIVTLAMATIYRGFAFVISDARAIYGFPEAFEQIGRAYIGPVPLPVLVGGVVFAVGSVILLKTVVGLRIYALGGSVSSTRLAGIQTERLTVMLFLANGALIGLVAALTTARLGSAQPQVGTNFELDVLTAVILGGVAFSGGSGHPLGVLIGVVTIGVLDAGIIFVGVPDFWQQIARGGVLLLALGFDQLAAYRREHAHASATAGDPATVEAKSLERPPSRASGGARELGPPVIVCRDLQKAYGSVVAVRGVSFAVHAGEIVCLVGDNGAGKSSVIKILSGAVEADAGSIEIDGQPVTIRNPHDARVQGIETAYQDLALCPNLGASYNLVLGAEPVRVPLGPFSVRDDRKGRQMADERLKQLGIVLDDDERPVRLLSGGQRQSVAIARIADEDVKVVILDEPTAALGVKQTRNVLDLVRTLADRGAAVILISHDIDTIFEVADRVVVLRLGRVVHDGPIGELTQLDLVHLMAGLRGGSVGATPATAPGAATPMPA
jgi:ribose/xylose/arabinose/galactoside ABC-type transport system permease subunit/ABC-type multidrug transport system ATPase subunit